MYIHNYLLAENAKPQFLFFESTHFGHRKRPQLIGLDIIDKEEDVHILLTGTSATKGSIKQHFECLATDIFYMLFYAGIIQSHSQARWYGLQLPRSLDDNDKMLCQSFSVDLIWQSGCYQNPQWRPLDVAKCPFDLSLIEHLGDITPKLAA